MRDHPIPPGRGSIVGRIAAEGRTVQIPDVLADPEYTLDEAQKLGGYRTMLGVPLLREGSPDRRHRIAAERRCGRSPTSRSSWSTTFADQAVIAIENVRLFDEVQARTHELAQSVSELRALGEVSQAVSSTLDLGAVLDAIVSKAVQLSQTEAGAIYVFDEGENKFELRSTYGMSEELIAGLKDQPIGVGDAIGEAAAQRTPLQIADLRKESSSPVTELVLGAGYRAVLIVPLLSPDAVIGALVVRRKQPGEFPKSTVELLQTFAAQSVLAIQNARLFSEIEEKGRQLAEASQHKSQFLANMSHELRTPLNAILGYAELILDNVYGETPDKMREVLDRIQRNGRHLLGLINDVLDLSKIEAGQLKLSLADYSLKDVVQSVYSAVEALRREAARAQGRGPAAPARRTRRRAQAHAGAAQPRRQRDQVHRYGRSGDQGFRGQRLVHGCGARHRAGHATPSKRKSSRSSSRPTRRSRRRKAGLGLDWRLPSALSSCMGGGCGSSRSSAVARRFSSRCPFWCERKQTPPMCRR